MARVGLGLLCADCRGPYATQAKETMVDVISLLTTWSRSETSFFEDFEPEHGNAGPATASELVEELTRYLGDN